MKIQPVTNDQPIDTWSVKWENPFYVRFTPFLYLFCPFQLYLDFLPHGYTNTENKKALKIIDL